MKSIFVAALLSFLALANFGQACIDKSVYYEIDSEIEKIASSINADEQLVHFYGGIVRLAAHDFMDYNRNSDTPFGSDGCIDWDHEVNKGLESIWCTSCPLTKLYRKKYSHISKADFWIVSANAVIRQLSKNQSLDLANAFLWGRKDANACEGSGDRIPLGTGTCRDVEETMLDAMGLEWRDAVALLGAHTIGKGHEAFSGHDGYWMPTVADSLRFDKQYYEELILRTWRARNSGTDLEDFTASTTETHEHPQMMLKSDVCLLYNSDSRYPCCSKTHRFRNGSNQCDVEEVLSNKKCIRYRNSDTRMQAVNAVLEYLGGSSPNDNQGPFYRAFNNAWYKATTNGHDNLKPLRRMC